MWGLSKLRKKLQFIVFVKWPCFIVFYSLFIVVIIQCYLSISYIIMQIVLLINSIVFLVYCSLQCGIVFCHLLNYLHVINDHSYSLINVLSYVLSNLAPPYLLFNLLTIRLFL